MQRFPTLALLALSCLAAPATRAQAPDAFAPGWHIVEPAARYMVLAPTMGDLRSAQEAAKTEAKYEMRIAVGEAVMAFARKGEVIYCFESSGRVSAIRGKGALTPTKPGSAAFLTAEFDLGDRKLLPSSTVWVLGIDASGERATLQLDRGRTQDVPAAAVRYVVDMLENASADKEWSRAK